MHDERKSSAVLTLAAAALVGNADVGGMLEKCNTSNSSIRTVRAAVMTFDRTLRLTVPSFKNCVIHIIINRSSR